jgi:hypothetical protein
LKTNVLLMKQEGRPLLVIYIKEKIKKKYSLLCFKN